MRHELNYCDDGFGVPSTKNVAQRWAPPSREKVDTSITAQAIAREHPHFKVVYEGGNSTTTRLLSDDGELLEVSVGTKESMNIQRGELTGRGKMELLLNGKSLTARQAGELASFIMEEPNRAGLLVKKLSERVQPHQQDEGVQ